MYLCHIYTIPFTHSYLHLSPFRLININRQYTYHPVTIWYSLTQLRVGRRIGNEPKEANKSTNASQTHPLPLQTNLSFEKAPLTLGALKELQHYSQNHLQLDTSPGNFIQRNKAIAFVQVRKDNSSAGDDVKVIHRLDQNYFIQPTKYNPTSSGGTERFYDLIPKSLLNEAIKPIILAYQQKFNIADGTTMGVHLQSSIIDPMEKRNKKMRMEEKVKHTSDLQEDESSVTGQGVHTDGVCHQMILCIERTNVEGAKNSFYKDLHGKHPIGKERVLEEGNLVYFRDNVVFHYVSPAFPKDTDQVMRRTVMIIGSPVDHEVMGDVNDENSVDHRDSLEIPNDADQAMKQTVMIIGSPADHGNDEKVFL